MIEFWNIIPRDLFPISVQVLLLINIQDNSSDPNLTKFTIFKKLFKSISSVSSLSWNKRMTEGQIDGRTKRAQLIILSSSLRFPKRFYKEVGKYQFFLTCTPRWLSSQSFPSFWEIISSYTETTTKSHKTRTSYDIIFSEFVMRCDYSTSLTSFFIFIEHFFVKKIFSSILCFTLLKMFFD